MRARADGDVGLLRGVDARRGLALGGPQFAPEEERVARPEGVDGPALAKPVFEDVRVVGEFGAEEAEFVEGFGCLKEEAKSV